MDDDLAVARQQLASFRARLAGFEHSDDCVLSPWAHLAAAAALIDLALAQDVLGRETDDPSATARAEALAQVAGETLTDRPGVDPYVGCVDRGDGS